MFDIAFSEIVVIAVVALIVIGPERLPKVARTLGHMFGRLQRYVNDVKADISREMELDELRKLKSEVQSAASEFESSIHKAAQADRLRRALGRDRAERSGHRAGGIRSAVGRHRHAAGRACGGWRGNAATDGTAGIRPDLTLPQARGGVPPSAALQWLARVCAWFASR